MRHLCIFSALLLIANLLALSGCGGGGALPATPVSPATTAPLAPTVHLTANLTTISPGQPVTLSWGAYNANEVISSNFGAAAISGAATVTPASTTTYTLTVAGAGGSSSAGVTITVRGEVATINISRVELSGFIVTSTAPGQVGFNNWYTLVAVSASGSKTLRLGSDWTGAADAPQDPAFNYQRSAAACTLPDSISVPLNGDWQQLQITVHGQSLWQVYTQNSDDTWAYLGNDYARAIPTAITLDLTQPPLLNTPQSYRTPTVQYSGYYSSHFCTGQFDYTVAFSAR